MARYQTSIWGHTRTLLLCMYWKCYVGLYACIILLFLNRYPVKICKLYNIKNPLAWKTCKKEAVYPTLPAPISLIDRQ